MNRTPKNTEEKSKRKKTSDAVEIINKTIVGNNSEMRELVAEATVNAMVASAIYDARKSAGLTQGALAELIDSKQPVISQLENADYEGHSLSMLKKIADALNQRLEIRFDAMPPISTSGDSAVMEVKSALHRELLKVVAEKNLAPADMGKMLGLDEHTAIALLAGKVAGITVDTLTRFLHVLGKEVKVSTSSRLEGTEVA